MIHEIYPHSFDNHYQSDTLIGENDFVLHFKDNTLLLRSCDDLLEIPRKKDFLALTDKTELFFLFSLNGISCFLSWEEPQMDDSQFVYQDINFFRSTSQTEIAWISLVGLHLRNWYAENKFCGKCGTKTQHKLDERAMECPNCHALFFPKISPAIIVAITCNNKLLLARNSNFAGAWYSLIAGYADVGETLEQTVVREVKEEVGLDVKNIRYCCSQPWPLSGSLMVAFVAEADESQPIVVDGNEIVEAAWFTRENLPNHPPKLGISGYLIDKFEKGEL
jgi:NAD+ diphosphatase